MGAKLGGQSSQSMKTIKPENGWLAGGFWSTRTSSHRGSQHIASEEPEAGRDTGGPGCIALSDEGFSTQDLV